MTIWIECEDATLVNFDHFDLLAMHALNEPTTAASVVLSHELVAIALDRTGPKWWPVARGPEDLIRSLLAWVRDQLVPSVIGSAERSVLIQPMSHPGFAALRKFIDGEEHKAERAEEATAARARELLQPNPQAVDGGRRGD